MPAFSWEHQEDLHIHLLCWYPLLVAFSLIRTLSSGGGISFSYHLRLAYLVWSCSSCLGKQMSKNGLERGRSLACEDVLFSVKKSFHTLFPMWEEVHKHGIRSPHHSDFFFFFEKNIRWIKHQVKCQQETALTAFSWECGCWHGNVTVFKYKNQHFWTLGQERLVILLKQLFIFYLLLISFFMYVVLEVGLILTPSL